MNIPKGSVLSTFVFLLNRRSQGERLLLTGDSWEKHRERKWNGNLVL